MGMLSAMYAGVSGLSVHGKALSSVADNIANLSTDGYKETRTNFGDVMVHSLTVGGAVVDQVGTGASVLNVQTMMTQGTFETTDVPTDMAINGRGFFSVRNSTSTNAGGVGTGSIYYTRAGQFSVDKQGYMINPSGYRLQGYNVDANGNLLQVSDDLRVTSQQADAIPTTETDLSLNLNAEDKTTHSASTAVSPTDSTTYNYQTSVRTYDSLGVSHDLSLYFQRLNGIPSNVPVGTTSAWKVSIFENQSGTMVPSPGTPPSNSYYLCFDTNGHLVGTTDLYGLPALGDMFTSTGAVNNVNSAISARAGETLGYTGQGAAQTLNSTLGLTITGNGVAGDTINLGTTAIQLPAGVYGSAAATATGFANAINASSATSGQWYAVANGSNLTIYPTSNTSTAGLGVTTALTYVTTTGNSLHNATDANNIIDTINNGRAASGTVYLSAVPTAGWTFTIGGTTLTEGVNFANGGTATATAANLAAAIAALGPGTYTATNNGPTVSIVDNTVGTAGNAVTLVTAGGGVGNVVLSDTRLRNGVDGTATTDVVASAQANTNGTYSLRLARATPGATSHLTIATGTNTLGASAGFTTTSWVQNQYAAAAEGTPNVETAGERSLAFNFTGATPNQTIKFDFTPTAASATTQSAGNSETFYLYQNGTTRGDLQSLDIDKTGLISGQFSNGTIRTLGAVVLTNFANPQAMERSGDNLWVATLQAGSPVVNRPGSAGLGQVESGALEQSNVDLASEFVKMINYQRAFQANSRTISTTDQMLQDLISLKR